MTNSKDNVGNFFDADSSDYLKHQYTEGADSFMSLRRECASDLIARHLAPGFDESSRFLDAGCGPGILLKVVGRYPIAYSGLDISQEMLALAKQQAAACPEPKFRSDFRQGDVEHLPFEAGSFHAAASLGVIEYLNSDDLLLSELTRVTQPRGWVLIAVTNRYSYNLMFEKLIGWLRRSRITVRLISYAKRKLRGGEFKPREFVMRRHSTSQFLRNLEQHGLEVVESRYWGMNFLPYPLNYLCGRGLNRFANRMYGRSRLLRGMGEGFIVLCRKKA